MLLPAHQVKANRRDDTKYNKQRDENADGVFDANSLEHGRKPSDVLVEARKELKTKYTYQKGPMKAQVLRTKLTKTPMLPASST